MSNIAAFGKVIGCCDNCRALLYEHSKRYWVKFQHDAYCFCRNCVTVIEPGFVEDELPPVPAVPLDKLCEWLAEHYGSPCQLGDIDPYPQCEPDENGECYGMRTDDKRCWHDYLTKWMEGLDGNK